MALINDNLTIPLAVPFPFLLGGPTFTIILANLDMETVRLSEAIQYQHPSF